MIPQYENLKIARYQYKIFAVILSSFEEVLFLDADNFPIVDPVEWMESKVFKDMGYVLWPDFWWATTSPHYFQVLNVPTPSLLSLGTTESGQIIISKRTHSDVLLLVLYYNIFGPSFYYPLLTQCDAGEGDKETWLYAAIALEKNYYQVRQKNGIIGHHTDEGFKSASMMQHDPQADYSTYLKEEREEREHLVFRKDKTAEVVFMHHNLIKLSPVEMVDWIKKNVGMRMWGPKEDTIRKFKEDLERAVWEELLWVACEYGDSLVNWNEEVCEGADGALGRDCGKGGLWRSEEKVWGQQTYGGGGEEEEGRVGKWNEIQGGIDTEFGIHLLDIGLDDFHGVTS
ncbi:hypothetical protein EYC84_002525 [Monilinia fructicola]|uniref:Alpha-1,2-mannosyltransferase n=1 Tax=Monilinia fructicola TaxID=38448 RepID=A0A5M9JQW2_MONFR|nr:hypothetical protein EYC84_002525 [Monilinia fructicola]